MGGVKARTRVAVGRNFLFRQCVIPAVLMSHNCDLHQECDMKLWICYASSDYLQDISECMQIFETLCLLGPVL